MKKSIYDDCLTGEDCHKKLLYLKKLEKKDMEREEKSYKNYCIYRIMRCYKLPYKRAEREFYENGMKYVEIDEKIIAKKRR